MRDGLHGSFSLHRLVATARKGGCSLGSTRTQADCVASTLWTRSPATSTSSPSPRRQPADPPRHPHRDAVHHLFENHPVGTVRDVRRDLDALRTRDVDSVV